MLNADSLLRVKTVFTQCTINAISTCNSKSTATGANVQQATEAVCLTKSRDSRCAEEPKTSLPSYASVSVFWILSFWIGD